MLMRMSLGVSEVLFLLVWMCANVLQWLLEVGSRNWIDRQESLIIRISSVCYASTRESSMDQLCDSELQEWFRQLLESEVHWASH